MEVHMERETWWWMVLAPVIAAWRTLAWICHIVRWSITGVLLVAFLLNLLLIELPHALELLR
jgi:hypothetical protein